MTSRSDRGSVSLLVLGLAAIVVVVSLLTADVAVFLAGRARAQLAADAAALAAAPLTFEGGDAAAEAAALAALNGARLTRCECDRDPTWAPRSVVTTVEVSVELSVLPDTSATATARAVFDPTRLRG